MKLDYKHYEIKYSYYKIEISGVGKIEYVTLLNKIFMNTFSIRLLLLFYNKLFEKI